MRAWRVSISLLWTVAISSASPKVSPFPKLSLAFERQNRGAQEQFVARGGGHSSFVEGASVAIANATTKVSIDFTGARKVMAIAGAVLPGKVNYIHGSDPRRWQIGLPTYASVTYR
jgi:hypothetical protein